CVLVQTGPSQAVVMSAEQLAKEYAADMEGTRKKYEDRWLQVTGEIVEREFNSAGASSVWLKGTDKVRVNCGFTPFEKNATRAIKIGQQLTVVGQYTSSFSPEETSVIFCLPIRKQ